MNHCHYKRLVDYMFPLAIVTFVLCWGLFALFLHNPASQVIFIFGNILLFIAILLIFLAIVTLRKHGQTLKETDFTATTTLVENGIYGVVRHPLYLGWLLTYPSAMMVSQHWVVIVFGVIGMVSMALISKREDLELTRKFGQAYELYINEVPRLNVIYGLYKKVRRQR